MEALNMFEPKNIFGGKFWSTDTCSVQNQSMQTNKTHDLISIGLCSCVKQLGANLHTK